MSENDLTTRTSRRNVVKLLGGLPLINTWYWSKDHRESKPISEVMGFDQLDRSNKHIEGPQRHLTELNWRISKDLPAPPLIESHIAKIYAPDGSKRSDGMSVMEYVTLPETRSEVYPDGILEPIWDDWSAWVQLNQCNISQGSVGEYEYVIGRDENPSEVVVEKEYIQQLPHGILRWEIGSEPEDHADSWFDVDEHLDHLESVL